MAARPAQPARSRGGRNLTGRAAVVLLVLGALVVSYAQSLRVWFDQHQQISSLQEQIRDSEQRVGELRDEIDRWEDDAYVRAQARQRLGWVMPGEIGYRVIGDDGEPLGTQPPSNGRTPATGDDEATWYTRLWGTVGVAGAERQAEPTPPKATPTPKPLITPPSRPPR